MKTHLLSIAGHKLYAPKGVGALYVARGTPIRPFTLGAGHERGLRPGTENVASIVGLGAACAAADRDLEAVAERVRGLRDELFERLEARVPGLAVNGDLAQRLPNTLNVRFPSCSGTELLARSPRGGQQHAVAALDEQEPHRVREDPVERRVEVRVGRSLRRRRQARQLALP